MMNDVRSEDSAAMSETDPLEPLGMHGVDDAGVYHPPVKLANLAALRQRVVTYRHDVRLAEHRLDVARAQAESNIVIRSGGSDGLGKNADDRKRNLTIILHSKPLQPDEALPEALPMLASVLDYQIALVELGNATFALERAQATLETFRDRIRMAEFEQRERALEVTSANAAAGLEMLQLMGKRPE